LVGKVFPSKSGAQVAFFERQSEDVNLVVLVEGGGAARWPLAPDATRLEVYWNGPSEVILGTSPLSPRMRIRWTVARR
jgi:hypothetical protein